MKYTHSILLALVLIVFFDSCKEMFEPENDNHATKDRLYSDPTFAEGILLAAYNRLPCNNMNFTDIATDDAVTNAKGHSYTRMALGEWSAIYNPMERWSSCNSSILNINDFLSVVDSVRWKPSNSVINELYRKRYKGEAYGLRALFQYNLLQSIGGYGADGTLLGIPLYREFMDKNDNFDVPRATFTESIEAIYNDIDTALSYLLVDEYKNVSQLPEGLDLQVDVSEFNQVFGIAANQRINGKFLKALKARVSLLVASPAFNENNDLQLWEKVAKYAGDVLKTVGGVSGLDPEGNIYYKEAFVNKVTPLADQKEMIWRTAKSTTLDVREIDNYPPLLYGSGWLNPTQNIVDAFPMANGYPISNSLSNYNAKSPYSGRDPRLKLYIIYDGNSIRYPIRTYLGSGLSAKDSTSTSTRTGYYLRKLLREDVNAGYPRNPSNYQKYHYNAHMRYTELFLIYAEAANEAWGPDGKGEFGFSARDVISAIRKRATIAQPDKYLASISGKEDMRQLIRNERRLELCFEGFRFWDLRRWKMDLTEPAKGVNITWVTGVGWDFEYVDVEQRNYNNEFMHYGPLPQSELQKYKSLVQNSGWN